MIKDIDIIEYSVKESLKCYDKWKIMQVNPVSLHFLPLLEFDEYKDNDNDFNIDTKFNVFNLSHCLYNVYIDDKVYDGEFYVYIVLFTKLQNNEDVELLVNNINYFTDYNEKIDDKELTIYKIKLPKEYNYDAKLLIDGKYTKVSYEARKQIFKYNSLLNPMISKNEIINIKTLDLSELICLTLNNQMFRIVKQRLSLKLDINCDDIEEIYSVYDNKNYFKNINNINYNNLLKYV